MTRPAGAGRAVLLLVAGLLRPSAFAQSPPTAVPLEGCRVVVDYRDAAIGEFPMGWQDYERLYKEAPGRARGVAVLTDADQTRSRAVGDYGDFRVCADRPR